MFPGEGPWSAQSHLVTKSFNSLLITEHIHTLNATTQTYSDLSFTHFVLHCLVVFHVTLPSCRPISILFVLSSSFQCHKPFKDQLNYEASWRHFIMFFIKTKLIIWGSWKYIFTHLRHFWWYGPSNLEFSSKKRNHPKLSEKHNCSILGCPWWVQLHGA